MLVNDRKIEVGTSLMAREVARTPAPSEMGDGLVLGQGIRSYVPQLKKKKRFCMPLLKPGEVK